MSRPDWMVVRRPGSPVLFFICMAAIIAIGWGNDVKSCQRSNAVRSAETISYQKTEQRALALMTVDRGVNLKSDRERYQAAQQTIRALHPLVCVTPYPPTK